MSFSQQLIVGNLMLENISGDNGNVEGKRIIIYGVVRGADSTYAGQGMAIGALLDEWPEVLEISNKLVRGLGLSEVDEAWVRELSTACGWEVEDVIEELKNIWADPSERVSRYKELFEEYYKSALKHKEKGDIKQAGEKMWGAVVALVKMYAAIKGAPVIHWSRGKIDRFIANNVEERYRDVFRALVDGAHILHEYFYEGDLDPGLFEDRWKETLKRLEEVKKIVYEQLSSTRTSNPT